MDRTFKSKIDKWFHFTLWSVLILTFYCFWQHKPGFGTLFLLFFVGLIEALLRTEYIISGEGSILVKCGFLPRYRIPIRSIREIRYINNTHFAYALSSERLQIITDDASRILSPVNTESFIKELRKKNPNIIVIENHLN